MTDTKQNETSEEQRKRQERDKKHSSPKGKLTNEELEERDIRWQDEQRERVEREREDSQANVDLEYPDAGPPPVAGQSHAAELEYDDDAADDDVRYIKGGQREQRNESTKS